MAQGSNSTKTAHLNGNAIIPGDKMVCGVNTTLPQRSFQQNIFINQLKMMEYPEYTALPVPGDRDLDGYFDASTSGSFRKIWCDQDYQRAGTFVLTWDGVGDCDAAGYAGVTEINLGAGGYPTVNRREYEITETNPGGAVRYITCTGKPTNIQFFEKSEETRLNAGNYFHSEFISEWGDLTVIRTMQLQGTNNSKMMNYDANDSTRLTADSWVYNYNSGRGNPIVEGTNLSAPTAVIARLGIELDCDLYIHSSHQITNTAWDSFVTDLWGLLTPAWKAAHKIWHEHSNEPWQSGADSNYADQALWFTYGDATTYEATYDPATAEATRTAHGHADGTAIRCYVSYKNGDWPWARGGQRYVINTGANTFKTSDPPATVTAATNAASAVLTIAGHGRAVNDVFRATGFSGGTWNTINGNDYTVTAVTTDTVTLNLDSQALGAFTAGQILCSDEYGSLFVGGVGPSNQVTLLRYKVESESSKTKAVNYAEAAADIWDRTETIIGAANLIRVGGAWFNSGAGVTWANETLAVAKYRRDVDYISFAPYYNPLGATPGYENETLDTLLANGKAGFESSLQNNLSVLIEAVGHDRIICYEGGDPGGDGSGSNTQAQNDKHNEWRDSDQNKEWWQFYPQAMAAYGFKAFMQYALLHPRYNGSDTTSAAVWWGIQQYMGDNSKRYQGFQPYLADGAPKLAE